VLPIRAWEWRRSFVNAQIARRLGIAEGTARKHLENIYRRLHVPSRTAAVTHALPHLGV
jgi:DNA-binding CsgD family transcriptional regulator